jgi:NhaP-type Na+/H+ or K+/H+ antiporter
VGASFHLFNSFTPQLLESLLNDGSAMILYFFFYKMINGTVYTPGTFIAFLVEMLVLSPLIGVLVGLLCFYLTRRTSRPTNLHIDFQIMFCFAAAYGSYYIAGALLQISGVLACCAAGVTVALLVNPSIVEHERMHEVWHIAEWVCNTLIFLLGGFIGGQHTYRYISVINVVLIVVMYIFLTLTRAVMLGMLFPVVSRIGMRMSVPDAVFVTSAGLRGALGKDQSEAHHMCL